MLVADEYRFDIQQFKREVSYDGEYKVENVLDISVTLDQSGQALITPTLHPVRQGKIQKNNTPAETKGAFNQ
jgi:hypothetical protein